MSTDREVNWDAGVSIGYDVFGVFDGHGGKQAANFAAKHVLPTLQEELADVTLTSEKAVPEELEAYSQLSAEDKLAWHTQDALVQQLPAALVNTFRKVQEQFHENTQVLLPTISNTYCLSLLWHFGH